MGCANLEGVERNFSTSLEQLSSEGHIFLISAPNRTRAENQFTDALATLASLIVIPVGDQIELPWYHDIYQFLSCGAYPESASAKDRRALRQLATRFVVCGDALYRRSPDGLLLLCLDRASADRVMREIHAGVCGPHMGGHMLARKIMRTGYFWLTMETDCCQFVQRCQVCQMHGDLIHVPPSELHALASLGHFQYGVLILLGRSRPSLPVGMSTFWLPLTISPSGWKLLLMLEGCIFKGEVDTLIQEYGIQHHRSSAYRPQTNGAVEAANKNIKRILRKMVETSRDWSEKLPFALWAYRTSFQSSTRAAYIRGEWAQSRYDQLSLLDEKRLRAADHVQAYQRKMTRAFRKRVKPRKFQRGDLVLKVLRGLISDPRGKFRPSWSGPYVIRDLTREGAAWLTDLDGNQFTEPVNVDQLKKFYA
ncbi:hypothetical protein CK203_064341 [Vitis vinifera]|uniref:Integrase catalytic domain-containing protein n=1 Tax=Vitis vinifera TaxID=29760 RepID=A0A438GWE1_VITVI|nr:hypothetical protein CK203_064341 [Vitis vinifera]